MSSEEEPPGERRVDFLTVGPFPRELALDLVARASRRIAGPCRLVRGPSPALVAIPGRTQADADRLLADLEAEAPRDGAVLLALTAADVGNPLFTFFFGRARLNGPAGLVSIARLSPAFYGLPDDPETTARRAVVEILHELGHVAGLGHCPDSRCVMRVTHGVEELDARGTGFCPRCLPAAGGFFRA